MGDDRAGDPLVAALWDVVEEWSSAAIQRTREAAATGPTEALDAEIRVLIAHAAQLRGVVEEHLDSADVATASLPGNAPVPEDPAEALARLHEVPLAEVCPECFTMVRLDELEAHELVCVRHKTIEKMDRMLEEDPEPEPALDAEPVPALEAEPVPEPAPDHTCNSADFERPLCESCGGLHWYCSVCGAQRDACRPSAAAV